ncbi:hypothetical protein [uncultured Duncaniella sp.]|uniref:hypothetical protein n=2 Tax=uncultured Duncaniella sp. TaxID=2768039 RepID=UPI0025B15555|nr:hypothetical protein [uncultured Duncaniella sp.]
MANLTDRMKTEISIRRRNLTLALILTAITTIGLGACARTTFSLPYGDRPATISVTRPIGNK